jgi:hypothetical protein
VLLLIDFNIIFSLSKFDIKETELYDKWVSEALNIGIEMNGGTDENFLKKETKFRT